MELTKIQVLDMLAEDEKNPINRGWIAHGKCVGETAGVIATALGLDAEFAQILGMIHDIGKRNTKEVVFHDILGYEYLKSLGIDDRYAAVCLTHSYLNNDDTCVAGGYLPKNAFRTEFIRNHTYTPYEEIINLCDLMCTAKRLTVEARMIDLLSRKGIHENSAYHLRETLKLKAHYDSLIPGGVYRLFPDLTTLDQVGIHSFTDLPENLCLNSAGV